MLTKNDIIEAVYHNKQVNECIARMEPEHLRDDLKSEVLEILLNQPEHKIRYLYDKGELVYYTIRILLTTAKSVNSNFNRLFRDKKLNPSLSTVEFTPAIDEFDEDDHRAERVERELLQEPVYELILRIKPLAYQQCPEYINELLPCIGWYKQYLLSLYLRFGTYRAVERETGIRHDSCFKTIRETIKELREYANTRA